MGVRAVVEMRCHLVEGLAASLNPFWNMSAGEGEPLQILIEIIITFKSNIWLASEIPSISYFTTSSCIYSDKEKGPHL